jgi:hypothetical protein
MNELIEKLRNAPIGLDDYTDYLEDALGCIDELDNQKAVFDEAFLFFESHTNADLGMPGPLVHFIEKFYPKYLDELSASVERVPTKYTVWMINRILNSKIESSVREHLLNLLHKVSRNQEVDDVIREQAIEHIKYQEK